MMINNDLIEFKQPQVNIIKMNDEYNKDEIKEILNLYDRLMIKATLPGCGKTTAIKNSAFDVLFVTPYNKLCQELRKDGFDSITLNKLLNINIMGEKNKYNKEKNVNEDAICFDEILLYNTNYLNKIYNYMNTTDKRIYATGDSDQLQSFSFSLNNVKDKKAYLNHVINMMFPNQIILSINKRLKTEEDKEILKRIKEDIFNYDIDVSVTMKKYFKTINKLEDVKTHHNITYFNFRSERINKFIQKTLKKPPQNAIKINNFYYYKGLELICKKYYKAKDKKIFTNYSYIITDIDNKQFTIIEPVENTYMTFENSFLNKYFKLSYCNTVHSVQGLSIDNKITIFDCNTCYVDRHFIWTAITRSTDLNNITYFEHPENEIKRLESSRVKQYIQLKIDSYKKQDADAKRKINKDKFINIQWFLDEIEQNKRCCLCNIPYYMVLDENNEIMCNITADRFNNDISHEKDNCNLMCCQCNCSKGNR